MKALRTVLLGSAGAALLFVTGTVAHAASAPGMESYKGKEPVWRCDTAGFIEYPGSDVCFKIGLTVTAWMGGAPDNVDTDVGAGAFDVWPDWYHSDTDAFWMGAWARPNIDIRKATEYGIVRLFAEFQIGKDSSMSGRHVFLQVGNWLVGNTSDVFHQGVGRPEQFDEGLGSIGDPFVSRVVQVRYTFDLGNGVQVNVAIEDPARFEGDTINSHHNVISDSRNEGPDVAANIKVSTTWGKIGASVKAHQESFWLSCTVVCGDNINRREWVWAALLGVQLNVGPNDTLKAMGGYADGYLKMLENGAAGGIGLAGHFATPTVKATGWSIVGGWTHKWSGTLRSTFAGAYVENDYHNINCEGLAGDCLDGAILNATNVWGNLIWTVVDGFDLGLEVMWLHNKRVWYDGNRLPDYTDTGSAVVAGVTASASY